VRFPLIVVRITLLVLSVAAGCRLLWWTTARPAQQAWRGVHGWAPARGWSLEMLVTDALACVALLAAVVGVLLAAMTILRGIVTLLRPQLGLAMPAWGPDGWRRLILGICGLGIIGPSLSSPALATEDAPAGPCIVHCQAPLAGLALPDLPLSVPRPTVHVHRGDTLWSIARDHAAPMASDQALASEVKALYERNRATIGADPDLIHPGTILILPGDKS
jgi:hypothetical protein